MTQKDPTPSEPEKGRAPAPDPAAPGPSPAPPPGAPAKRGLFRIRPLDPKNPLSFEDTADK